MKKSFIAIILIITTIIVVIVLYYFKKPTDLCEQKVKINGPCEALRSGYEFDSSTQQCVRITKSGCSVVSPFETIEECQNTCIK